MRWACALVCLTVFTSLAACDGGYKVEQTRLSTVWKLPAGLHGTAPAFAKDGLHVAYPAANGAGVSVAVDGVDGPVYDQVEGIVFSPEGNHVAYAARRGRNSAP